MKTPPADITTAPAAAAVADPEAIAKPQTAAEIAESEAQLGLATTPAAATGRANVTMGVAPKSIEEAWRLSKFIAASELVPKGYQGRPSDVLVAIQYGMEVGLPPMAALHSIFVTNGRPQLWGDGLLAVVMGSPKYADHEEYYIVEGKRKDAHELEPVDLSKDDTRAVTTFWRSDSKRPRTAAFSIAKAKKAGLWSKRGPWQEYPDRMLQMRARSFAAHDCFPDVLRGVHSIEELRDMVTPMDAPEPEPPREVRRLSESKPAAPAAAEMPASEDVEIGPVKVLDVEQFLGGYTLSLHNGQYVDVLNDLDALELEKFKGTANAVRLLCTKGPESSLVLKSFAIAD